MAYKVVITQHAAYDLERAATWYAEISPDTGHRWREEMLSHITSLEENPLRCAIAQEESMKTGRSLHFLLHGKKHGQYRILFQVKDNVVTVLSIRHASRQRM